MTKKKIIIYENHLRRIGGTKTFLLALVQKLKDIYDVYIVYNVADEGVLDEFFSLTNCIKNEMQEIEADTCLYNSIFRQPHNIKADKYIQIVHLDYKKWGINFSTQGVNLWVAVNEKVADSMKENYGIESLFIPNIIPDIKPHPFLRFATISRITKDKGFGRLPLFIRKLKESNVPFTFDVVGDGPPMDKQAFLSQVQQYPEVRYLGILSNEATRGLIEKVDFVVQLSDSESYCYSIHESLSLGKPVIVTKWEGVEQTVMHGENGLILDMNLENFDIQEILELTQKQENIKEEYKRKQQGKEIKALELWSKIL